MLKINGLEKDLNKSFDKKEIKVYSEVSDKEYKVIIDKKFKKTKLTKLITDMMTRADYCKKNDIVFDFALTQWSMVLKHFTDLEFKEYADMKTTYLKELKMIEILIDLEILDKIINSFDQQELLKIQDTSNALSKFATHMHNIEIDQMIDGIVGDEVESV